MRKLLLCLSVVGLGLLCSVSARAEVISFGDTAHYWTGWGNGEDDGRDAVGTPDFTGGTATIENGILTTLTINIGAADSLWSLLAAGDLFIDLDADNTWDYVLDLTTWTKAGLSNPDAAEGYYNLYAADLALNDADGYILSGTDGSRAWSTRRQRYDIRDGHPVAAKDITDNDIAGQVYFSGWGSSPASAYTFDFGDGLDLGDSGIFAFSWMPNCANDVIYEKLSYDVDVVPEPATLMLMLSGLCGLGAFRRRRFCSKK